MLTGDQLLGVATSAIERFASVVMQPAVSGANLPTDILAAIEFASEDARGRLILAADYSLLREMASQLLGTRSESVDDEEASQTLTELANVLGGEVIHALGGLNIRYDLGLPELVTTPPSHQATGCDVLIESAAGRLAVHLRTS